MEKQYRLAGYVKLAKLWEKNKEQAVELHNKYFQEKCEYDNRFTLQGVYLDITGNKHIYKRREMVRLLRDCKLGKIDLIMTQTRAYLAPNSEEFCFLIKFISEIGRKVDLITADDDRRIDTLLNTESQKESLLKMAETYVALERKEYDRWRENILKAMNEIAGTEEVTLYNER